MFWPLHGIQPSYFVKEKVNVKKPWSLRSKIKLQCPWDISQHTPYLLTLGWFLSRMKWLLHHYFHGYWFSQTVGWNINWVEFYIYYQVWCTRGSGTTFFGQNRTLEKSKWCHWTPPQKQIKPSSWVYRTPGI